MSDGDELTAHLAIVFIVAGVCLFAGTAIPAILAGVALLALVKWG